MNRPPTHSRAVRAILSSGLAALRATPNLTSTAFQPSSGCCHAVGRQIRAASLSPPPDAVMRRAVENRMRERARDRVFSALPPPAKGYRLYCDLDGVLADFESSARDHIVDMAKLRSNPAESWKKLEEQEGFFANLPWMPGGRELWAGISFHNPIILTGLPRGTWAAPQKRAWCEQHLTPSTDVITCMRHEKAQLSIYGNILIDDDKKTCLEWEKYGGHAILHTAPNIEHTLKHLRTIIGSLEDANKPRER